MLDQMSGLRLYGVGIVIKDLVINQTEIDVYMPEQHPLVHGLISELGETVKETSKTKGGSQKTSEIKKEFNIKAKWMPFGVSNRHTPPNVKANESVIIFRYGDTESYYWTTIFNEPSIRGKETVVYLFGNDDNSNLKQNNSHWLSVSSHKKQIKFHTSMNDGEHCGYDIELDLKNGAISIKDTKGNIIKLDSKNNEASIKTNAKITLTAPTVTVNASTCNINANTNIKGNLSVSGNTNTSGTTNTGNLNTSGSASGHYPN